MIFRYSGRSGLDGGFLRIEEVSVVRVGREGEWWERRRGEGLGGSGTCFI